MPACGARVGGEPLGLLEVGHVERDDERVLGARDHGAVSSLEGAEGRGHAQPTADVGGRREPLRLQVADDPLRDPHRRRGVDQRPRSRPAPPRPRRASPRSRRRPSGSRRPRSIGTSGTRARHLEDGPQRHRLDRGPAEPSGDRTERRTQPFRPATASAGGGPPSVEAVRPRAHGAARRARRRRSRQSGSFAKTGTSDMRATAPTISTARSTCTPEHVALAARGRGRTGGPRSRRPRGDPGARRSAGRTPRATPPAIETIDVGAAAREAGQLLGDERVDPGVLQSRSTTRPPTATRRSAGWACHGRARA